MQDKWDVILVGAGPGGTLAAKICAGHGLNTLLLEKKKIPRDKCCSGMVMGGWGQDLVKEEFGDYPGDVLKETTMLDGYSMIVPGAGVRTFDLTTPATWRIALDTWMCEKAKRAGAEIWDPAKVTDITSGSDCTVTIKKKDGYVELHSRYAIGADGSNSITRKALFPDIKPALFAGYRECYKVKIDHPRNRFNIYPGMGTNLVFFTHDKGDCMLLEGIAARGKLKETIGCAKQHLIKNHGMPPGTEPAWRDGCVQSSIYREIASGKFRPVKGNALLIGDAGGLNIPITGEGLASSLLSGKYAALSIIEATDKNGDAGEIYLEWINDLLKKFAGIYQHGGKMIKEATVKKDPGAYSEAMTEAWKYALRLF
ncbi:MAG: NAD(P)/FAD-dependent oxidoreductase [Spirochaetes bacterium]|nr:NAD(P)/FAD-dependent oxidoreductase [Spirochaetota bacterium]